ncbi:MAG: restriction endonuclease [Crocinitomicaceae bacterium]
MTKKKGPEFIKYIKPIVETLRELGGSGNSGEVTDIVIEKMGITEEELEVVTKTGVPRIKNQIHWARMYLVNASYIDSSKRGVWALTEEGLKVPVITHDDAYTIFKKGREKFEEQKKSKESKESKSELDEDDVDFEMDYRDELLKILQALPPEGFERICQRLLRESGFKKVIVTGKSGDGGIDGEGILEINPLLSFKVLFQSKRYQGSVSSSQVRDFRGAMTGRADKGIIITTGRFTQDAKKEAIRDGAPPIELVDGDGIIDLFEKNQLGLKPIMTYEIDSNFFEEFK